MLKCFAYIVIYLHRWLLSLCNTLILAPGNEGIALTGHPALSVTVRFVYIRIVVAWPCAFCHAIRAVQ